MTDSHSFPKVRLRALEPEDLDFLYTIENNPEEWGCGVTNVPYSRYLLHQYISSASADIYVDKQVRLMIVDEVGDAVGMVDLFNFSPQHLRAEVGIIIHSKYRHKGYAAAALQLLTEYAEKTVHLHQLYAVIDKNNTESLSLFTQNGFLVAASLSDWLFDGSSFHDAVVLQKKI